MRRILGMMIVVFVFVGLIANPVAAQNAGIDSAFSDEILSTLGYPEITIEVGPDGVVAPTELPAGFYHVTLKAAGDYVAYLVIVQTQ